MNIVKFLGLRRLKHHYADKATQVKISPVPVERVVYSWPSSWFTALDRGVKAELHSYNNVLLRLSEEPCLLYEGWTVSVCDLRP
ncbi:hypothetical protein MHYP_G00294070 [Metynnis hypsauchen]